MHGAYPAAAGDMVGLVLVHTPWILLKLELRTLVWGTLQSCADTLRYRDVSNPANWFCLYGACMSFDFHQVSLQQFMSELSSKAMAKAQIRMETHLGEAHILAGHTLAGHTLADHSWAETGQSNCHNPADLGSLALT